MESSLGYLFLFWWDDNLPQFSSGISSPWIFFSYFGLFNHFLRNEPGQKKSKSDPFESHEFDWRDL
jgi:hypothetical protein